MYRRAKTFRALIVAGLFYSFYTSSAAATNLCQADLGRINKSFCLSASLAKQGSPLSYTWNVADGVFDLTARTCAGGPVGVRRDLVIAIDRSALVASSDYDASLGSKSLAMARQAIDAYTNDDSATAENDSPRVGLIVFSSKDGCTAYQGGSLPAGSDVPCVYVPAESIASDEHRTLLKGLLNAIDGTYSRSSPAAGADFGIIAHAMKTNILGADLSKRPVLMLMTDGRTFANPTSGDPYAYLRSANYQDAEKAAIQAFSELNGTWDLSVALTGTNKVVYNDQNSVDAYSNMCQLAGATPADCQGNVNQQDPTTWPVNSLDINEFSQKLLNAVGSDASNVSQLNQSEVAKALDKLRYSDGGLDAEAVQMNINGTIINGVVSGHEIVVSSIPVASQLNAVMTVKTSSGNVDFPLSLLINRIKFDGKPVADKEMLCQGSPNYFANAPTGNHKRLGGGARCGVVASGSAASRILFWILIFAPLGVVFRSKRRLAMATSLTAVALSANSAQAASVGANIEQYRPVVDGIGMVEQADGPSPLHVNAGLFFDYASSPLELGDGSHKVTAVVDHLAVGHFAANAGLLPHLSLGLELPVLASASLDSEQQGQQMELGGAQLMDGEASLKLSLWHSESFGIALMPFVTLPLGDQTYMAGDGQANPGLRMLLSGHGGGWGWALSSGYLKRREIQYLEDDRAAPVAIKSQFENSAALSYDFIPSVALESTIQTKFTAGQKWTFSAANPAEAMADLRFKPGADLAFYAGAGRGLGEGYGAPAYRLFAGITFVPRYQSERRIPATRFADRPTAIYSKQELRTAKLPETPQRVIVIGAQKHPDQASLALTRAPGRKPPMMRKAARQKMRPHLKKRSLHKSSHHARRRSKRKKARH